MWTWITNAVMTGNVSSPVHHLCCLSLGILALVYYLYRAIFYIVNQK